MTEEHPFSAAPKSPHRWLLLMMVGLGLLLVTVDITILLTALPVLTHELHASAAEGLWIVNAYPLFSTGLLLGAGTLGDRIGHRRTYLVGLVIFGLASLMAAYAASVAVLVLARVLRGLRDWIIGKDGVDTADRIIPDWQIEDLNRQAEAEVPDFAEPDLPTPTKSM